MTLNGGQELGWEDRDSRALETGGVGSDGAGRRRGIDPEVARHPVDCGARCRRRDALDGQTARPLVLIAVMLAAGLFWSSLDGYRCSLWWKGGLSTPSWRVTSLMSLGATSAVPWSRVATNTSIPLLSWRTKSNYWKRKRSASGNWSCMIRRSETSGLARRGSTSSS